MPALFSIRSRSSSQSRSSRPRWALACLLPALACTGDDGGSGASATTSESATTSTTEGMSTTTAGTSTTTDDPTTSPTTTTTGPNTTSTTEDCESECDTNGESCYAEPKPGAPPVTLHEVARGFDRPLFVAADPSNPERLFVVEQGGRIKILEPGMTDAPEEDFLFVEVKNAVPATIGPEQGLLGFAFHPNYPADPRVYVNYNPAGGGATPTYIDEFKLDRNNPNRVDPESRRRVIAIHQPAGNHNGGMITFGADGYLYIGMGDGGGSNDAFNTGRDPAYLHAKILRIGVEPDGIPDTTIACPGCPELDGFDYTIPADNPFVDDPSFLPEIWAWGVRNPWRMDFDRPTGLLYMADVGQGQWEEISIASPGGDYGWSVMEGNHCFGGKPCDPSAGPNQANADGMIAPIAEYNHQGGRCSVTGGYVYRGCEAPGWDGIYFYGDYCSGEVFALLWDGQSTTDLGVVANTNQNIFGSGIDGFGRVYLTTVEINDFKEPIEGRVIRLDPG